MIGTIGIGAKKFRKLPAVETLKSPILPCKYRAFGTAGNYPLPTPILIQVENHLGAFLPIMTRMRKINTHANSLRQRRVSAGVTQIQLVVNSGVSLSTINRLENHPLPTSAETAQKLAMALGCRVEEIFPFITEEGARHARN